MIIIPPCHYVYFPHHNRYHSLLRHSYTQLNQHANLASPNPVGLSRHPTNDDSRNQYCDATHPSDSACSTSAALYRPISSTKSHTDRDRPFSPEDLTLALKKSNLESPKEESDHSGDASPMPLPKETSKGGIRSMLSV